MKPRVNFHQNREMEARGVLYLAAVLPTKYLQNKGFVVLPYLPKYGAEEVVNFPDLNYGKMEDFWERCKELRLETPIDAPKDLIGGMVKLLEPEYIESEYVTAISQWEMEWRGLEKTFWERFSSTFIISTAPVTQIDVYVTQYGPRSTFSLAGKGRKKIHIFLRSDQGVAELMWVILTCFLRPEMEKELKFTWEECEAAVDMLMRKTTINCGLEMTKPIIKELRSEQKGKYKAQSQKFLQNLNLGSDGSLWSKTDRTIKYGSTSLVGLGSNERRFLELLIENQSQVVTFDQVLELLWPGNEEIMVGTVIKLAERLRRKLERQGIPRKVIQTQRKVGYILVK